LQAAITAMAIVGLAARVVVFGAVGVFVFEAAVRYDPHDAAGLDGALHRLAHAQYGTFVLVAVATGLLAYAAYSTVEALLRPSPED
jgi:hypothetical protein